MEALDAFALVRRQAPSVVSCEPFFFLIDTLLTSRFQNANNDQNVGKNRGSGSPSLSGLISTLVPTLVIFLVFITLFLILRRTQQRQYAPRTYLGALREQERSPSLPNSLLGWIPTFSKVGKWCHLQHRG